MRKVIRKLRKIKSFELKWGKFVEKIFRVFKGIFKNFQKQILEKF
jgi:hypothetical protein